VFPLEHQLKLVKISQPVLVETSIKTTY